MLINLRNALMAGKRLPYDAEVEYLESTGTQWIDTGVYGNQDTKIELAISITSFIQTNYSSVFGNYNSSSDSISIFAGRISGSATTRFGNAYTNSFVLSAATRYDIVVDKNGVSYNDSTIQWSPSNTFTTNGTLIAFGRNVTTYGLFIGKVYYCKIYAGSILVRDYIPVRKGTVGYLYDRVSGKLFGNAGTGDFVLGPDVVPVEYILQTGTQYIDTLYPMADTRREVITVDWSGHSTTYREFMAGAASGSYLIEMSPTGYYGTAPTNLSSIQVSQKDRIRWDYTVGSKPSLYINDVFAINDTLVRVPTGNVMTGGVGTPGLNFPKIKIYGIDIFADADEQVRKMLPVRVGTDATSWEGAMMDVLTRRIYRNQGTGAFAYGNDLKYPIPAS